MRILIAGGQAPIRAALRMLLQERHALVVIREAADSAELLAELTSARFDVVLLDWDLSGQPPEGLLPALHRLSERPSVIVLSGRPEMEPSVRAAGADAFVSMCEPPQRLLATLQSIAGEKGLEG